MQSHHEAVLQQLSSAFQEQLAQAVVRATQTADAAAAAAAAQHSHAEAQLMQQIKDHQTAHQQQLQQQQDARRMLQTEHERAAAAQEQSTTQVRTEVGTRSTTGA